MKERSTPTGAERRTNMVTQGYSAANALGSDGPLSSQPIPSHDGHYQDQAQFESDKRAVYKHPLFPLLALLFEKCEIATQTSPESAMSASFHNDLEAFVQHQERDRKPFLAEDAEVDSLMIKAIQVLRIHLLELDKVQELCKDFCTRYITCLKGKMQSENLLRSDYYDTNSNNGSTAMLTSSHSNSPHNSCYSSNGEASISPAAGNAFHLGIPFSAAQSSVPPALMNNCNASPEHSSTESSHHSSASPTLGMGIHGGTPLSQIGANISNPCPTTSNSQDSFLQAPNSPSSGDEEEDYLGRKKPKRGVLPKHATSIMRSWLFQHIVHPYPTEDEKRQIAAQTNLTLLQVNNWFINARRRILQPMLDASNPEPSAPKAKKLKTNGSKPALKYWSDNLATMGSGADGADGSESGNGMGPHQEDESEQDSEGESSTEGNDLLIDNSDSSQQ